MKISGKVIRGLEESGKFLTIPWVAEQIKERLSFLPYLGTLNILLDDRQVQAELKDKARERITHREEGFCDACLIKAVINGRIECGIIIPLLDGYPRDTLEVVASVRLKDALNIDDGDMISLDIEF